LFIVNMPITDKNKQLIDQHLYGQFNTNISQLPGQFGATFINMDDSNYDPKLDYLDSVHLSDQGAPKLINRLVEKITPRIICARTKQ
jgi:lysophospholipase L1-like esterase